MPLAATANGRTDVVLAMQAATLFRTKTGSNTYVPKRITESRNRPRLTTLCGRKAATTIIVTKYPTANHPTVLMAAPLFIKFIRERSSTVPALPNKCAVGLRPRTLSATALHARRHANSDQA